MKYKQRSRAGKVALASLILVAGCSAASAGTIVPCDGNCTWSIDAAGSEVASGMFTVDPTTGKIDLGAPVSVDLGDGSSVTLQSLSGNSDPILGFSVAAGTGTTGKTFSFNFSLPISLSGPVQAASSLSYSLTSLSGAGAQIAPLIGSKVLIAQDVDSSVGSTLPPLDKGVNVGDRFFFTGGPKTENSNVFTATNGITGNPAYDLMSVTLGFILSANSNVGASGFVSQTPVPLPAAGYLFVLGLAGLAGLRKRSPA